MIDLAYIAQIVPDLLAYIPITLFLTVVSMLGAMVIGLVMALIRLGRVPVLYQAAGIYISFFRGVPSLVLLFLVYYGLPQVIPAMTAMNAMTAAIIGFSLHESGYLAEIFRAALISVDPGQREAGLSVGLKRTQIYRRIILPQAAYNAIPSTANIFIMLLKNTSVAFTLGLTELFAEAKIIASAEFRYFETYLTVGLIYWLMVIGFSWLQTVLEKKLAKSYAR